jgi:hypothetical protein
VIFVGARPVLKIPRVVRPNDLSITHQLTLATDRSEQPTPLDAQKETRDQLSALLPQMRTRCRCRALGAGGGGVDAIRQIWKQTR